MTSLKINGTVPREEFMPLLKNLHKTLLEEKYDLKRIHIAGMNDYESFSILLPPELLTDELSDVLGGVAMRYGAILDENIEEV